jgi:hypothetical protein
MMVVVIFEKLTTLQPSDMLHCCTTIRNKIIFSTQIQDQTYFATPCSSALVRIVAQRRLGHSRALGWASAWDAT